MSRPRLVGAEAVPWDRTYTVELVNDGAEACGIVQKTIYSGRR